MFYYIFILLIAPCLPVIAGSWVMDCAKEGLVQGSTALPVPSSLSDSLLSCMVDHVMISPFNPEQLLIVPTGNTDWCLPEDFFSGDRTCDNLQFDFFEPIRHCIEDEDFPELSSDTRYSQDFNDNDSAEGQGTFYLSSRLAHSMCVLLDGVRSASGRDCILQICRDASDQPSQSPSMEPSVAPSSGPTTVPSNDPSMLPSISPSAQPSREASAMPFDQPSALPSSLPSPAAVQDIASQTPLLHIKTTLRVLLDYVGPLDSPPSGDVTKALEDALKHILGNVKGFQKVEIASITRAPVTEDTPVTVSFRVVALRECNDLDCADHFVGRPIARGFQSAFEAALRSGHLKDVIQNAAELHGALSLLEAVPRPNSSNLMSYDTYVIDDEREEPPLPVSASWYPDVLGGWILLGVLIVLQLLI